MGGNLGNNHVKRVPGLGAGVLTAIAQSLAIVAIQVGAPMSILGVLPSLIAWHP